MGEETLRQGVLTSTFGPSLGSLFAGRLLPARRQWMPVSGWAKEDRLPERERGERRLKKAKETPYFLQRKIKQL